MKIGCLPTPTLLLEQGKMHANIERMTRALKPLGVDLRPHVKTCKSPEIVREMTKGWSEAVTVSTMREAEEMFAAGYRDILYAVGIVPAKLPQVERLTREGAMVTVIVDSVEAAQAVSDYGRDHGLSVPVLIEIDCDGHRAGLPPDDRAMLVHIGSILGRQGAELRGVMTHGGGSYDLRGLEALERHSELERDGAVEAAQALRAAGLPCPIVSVGSTPTALFAEDLSGVTEVRVGVYVFQDLVMSGIGVCTPDEIAISVLTRVIGHQPKRGSMIVDAGWMALSRDRGTANHEIDQGYGLVCDVAGNIREDLVVATANQEHGIIVDRGGKTLRPADYPIGSLVRILPNHACATAAQHDSYQLVEGDRIAGVLPRFRGW